MSVKERVEVLLNRVADVNGLSNFEVFTDQGAIRGDGFLSVFYTGRIIDKNTGKVIEIYIKLPPHDQLDSIYENEYLYYHIIYPALKNFQQTKSVDSPFNNIPLFFCGGKDGIVLENLKVRNYKLYDKANFLDEKHLKAIFKLYGKYHALTFSYKDQNQEEYEKMIRKAEDIFKQFKERAEKPLILLFNVAYEAMKEVDEEKAEKILPYVKDADYMLNKATAYVGKYSALTHGDCWSNNMMFKYTENGDIEDIKLLDHQLLRNSTPVHDLSYFFYSGASKHDFEKLDEYLKLYYKSFCKFAIQLGSDPEKLLPFKALKADWKEYGFLGVRMGIMVWQAKLIPREDIAEGSMDPNFTSLQEKMVAVHKSANFRSKITDILSHAIDNGLL